MSCEESQIVASCEDTTCQPSEMRSSEAISEIQSIVKIKEVVASYECLVNVDECLNDIKKIIKSVKK
jgi:hypothetical protein